MTFFLNPCLACHCVTGYEVTSSQEALESEKTCSDINECEANPCDEVTQICQNSAGSFKCECRLGFENIAHGAGTGTACQDINGNHKKPINLTPAEKLTN